MVSIDEIREKVVKRTALPPWWRPVKRWRERRAIFRRVDEGIAQIVDEFRDR